MKKEQINSKLKYLPNYIVIVISLITSILLIVPTIYKKEYVVNKLMNKVVAFDETSEEYKNYSTKIYEQHEKIIKYERYSETFINSATQSLHYYILSGQDDIENKIEQFYERMSSIENKWKHNSNLITQKNKNITMIMKQIEDLDNPKYYDWIVKLSTININEYEKSKKELTDVYKEEHKDIIGQSEYRELQENYEYAKRAYDNYYLGVKINNSTQIDLKEFIKDNELEFENKNDIIIYHTHTTEAFKSDNYEKIENGKTLNENYNILAVGEKLSNSLIEKGFQVKHIRKYNDIDNFYRSI